MRKKRVFVSHPCRGNILENRKKADKICKYIIKKGYIPISPLHLFSCYQDDRDRKDIVRVCYELINICDEVWIYGDTDGCRKEEKYARMMGKKVKVCYEKTDYKELMEANKEVHI